MTTALLTVTCSVHFICLFVVCLSAWDHKPHGDKGCDCLGIAVSPDQSVFTEWTNTWTDDGKNKWTGQENYQELCWECWVKGYMSQGESRWWEWQDKAWQKCSAGMSLQKQDVINEEVEFMLQRAEGPLAKQEDQGGGDCFWARWETLIVALGLRGFHYFFWRKWVCLSFVSSLSYPLPAFFSFLLVPIKQCVWAADLGSNGRDKRPITNLSVVCQANCSYSLKSTRKL